jgi:hypothetical protein
MSSLPVLFKTSEGRQDGFAIYPGSRKLTPVMCVNREDVLRVLTESQPGKRPKSFQEQEWNFIQAAHSLRNALGREDGVQDELELEKAFQFLGINYPSTSRGGSAADLWSVVALDRLGESLSPARLVFWFDDRTNELLPGIYCPDFKTAVITSFLLGDEFHICPRCRKVFTGPKTYCSTRCQGAHRVARFRARQEQSGSRKQKNRRINNE